LPIAGENRRLRIFDDSQVPASVTGMEPLLVALSLSLRALQKD